jgi:hypothetical protein
MGKRQLMTVHEAVKSNKSVNSWLHLAYHSIRACRESVTKQGLGRKVQKGMKRV